MTVLNARPDYTTGASLTTRSTLDFLLKLSDWFIFHNLIEARLLGWMDYRVDLLQQKTYRKLAHTAKPSLDVMPFLVLSQAFYGYGIPRPLLRQNCFPLMHGRILLLLDML